jgi:hypothetical protein
LPPSNPTLSVRVTSPHIYVFFGGECVRWSTPLQRSLQCGEPLCHLMPMPSDARSCRVLAIAYTRLTSTVFLTHE